MLCSALLLSVAGEPAVHLSSSWRPRVGFNALFITFFSLLPAGLVVSGTVHAANSDWWGLLDELSIAVPTQLPVH
jgi:hypothetical protein